MGIPSVVVVEGQGVDAVVLLSLTSMVLSDKMDRKVRTETFKDMSTNTLFLLLIGLSVLF